MKAPIFDIAVIGEGVNGGRIARDIAGRNLSAYLCEHNDLAGSSSSTSKEFIQSDLRYRGYCTFHSDRDPLTAREGKLSPSFLLSIHNCKITTNLKLDECRNIQKSEDTDHYFGENLYEVEVSYLSRIRFARTATDTLCAGLILDWRLQAGKLEH